MFLKKNIKLKIIGFFFLAIFCFSFGENANAYTNQASWTSPIKKYGAETRYGTISWTETVASNSTISVFARAGNTDTPDESWTDWTQFSNGQSLSSLDLRKRIQYRIDFDYEADEYDNVPSVSDVTISTYSGEIVSSVFDSRNFSNQVSKISWVENLPGVSDVIFQIRTSPDKSTWTAWCGPDNGASGCDSHSWFSDFAGNETIESDLKTISVVGVGSDRYLQYRFQLFSDNANIPVVSNVNLFYDRIVEESIWTSPVKDALLESNFKLVSWNEVTPNDTSVSIKARSGNVDVPDGTWTDWITISENGGSLSALSGNRYIQIQAVFSSFDFENAASVQDITIEYSNNHSVGTFQMMSSPYDTNSYANLLANIKWEEDLAQGTNVKFQMRSAPDLNGAPDWANGSGWCGPINCAVTKDIADYSLDYYETEPLGEISNPIHREGDNDQWIQYALWLSTDSQAKTPLISNVTLTYLVNATPEIQNISAIQNSEGTVAVDFQVRDADTSTGTTQDSAILGLEYCTENCNSPGNEVWQTATAISGDVGAKEVREIVWSDYQITWNPKSEFAQQYYPTYKVRVTANDSEVANSIGRGLSNEFALDTKNPIAPTFTIDHTTNELLIQTPQDDLSYDVYIGNSIFSLFNIENKTVLNKISIYPATYSYLNMTSDPATVYVGIKDEKGNTHFVSMTTPARPSNIVYYDVSNSLIGEYREFIAWDVVSAAQSGSGFSAYKIYRSIDNTNFDLLASVSDRLSNYYLDTDVVNANKYYYKLYTEDINGNKSVYSATVDDIPDGQGGTDSTAPTISNVQVSEITTTSARITWTTDELSDSSVGYSEGETYLPERGIASLVLNHEIILTNLEPSTTYNIRTKSRDLVGNLGQNDKDSPGSTQMENFTFSTLPGPSISRVNVTQIDNNQAEIEWQTTTNSNSYVIYSDAVDGSGQLVDAKEFGSPDEYVLNHKVTISSYKDLPLNPSSVYYFSVKSVDQAANIATDNNANNFYEFLTTEDLDAPLIFNLSEVLITHNEAIVTWTTDEPSNSKIEYGTESGGYTETQEIATFDRSHFVVLSTLSPETEYFYKITSSDINGNQRQSEEQSFTTNKDLEFQHDPLSAIVFDENNPSVLTDKVAVISFITDQAARCLAEYGTEEGNYFTVTTMENAYNQNHALHIPDLVFSTKYYYKVICRDNLETVVESDEQNFITMEKQYLASGIGELLDSTPPVISGVSIADIAGETVTINWKTDEKANSFVRYGFDNNFGMMAGNDIVNSDNANYTTEHSVTISNLIPSSKYFYRVMSADGAGNIAVSGESTFTTSSPSSITSINAVSDNIGEAVITWDTSTDTTSIVEYGLSTTYSEKKESSEYTDKHSISISGLNQGSTYHFRVRGKDKNNKFYSSSDQTFEPKSRPKIENVSIDEIDEHGATVSFKTNVPTQSLVLYEDIESGENSGSQGRFELAIEHKIKLLNLKEGTTFGLKIRVQDEQGTQTEETFQNFQTSIDENPPKIEQVRTESALTQSDKVQAIISWKTNENANTAIVYKEGRAGKETEIKVSDVMTTSHIAVITTFKTGTVYYFNAKSIDASGNEAKSSDFALLTPKRKENIIQIIVNNFQEIFGWAQR